MEYPPLSFDIPKPKKMKSPEDRFQATKFKFHHGLIKFLIIGTLLYQILTTAINPFNRNLFLPKYLAINLVLILLMLLGIYITRRKFLHTEQFIVTFIILHLVYILELKGDMNSIWPSNATFTYGALYQLLLLSMPLARVSWKYSTFVGVFISILLLTRYLNFNENSKYIVLSLFSSIIFGVSFTSYILEKYEWRKFLQTRTLKSNQKKLIKLILDVLPSAALIFKNGKIISTNDKVEKMFNNLSHEEILNETKNIKIKSKIEEYENIYSPIYSPKKEPSENNNVNKIAENNELLLRSNVQENEEESLFNIINLKTPPEFKRFIGFIKRIDDIPINEDQNYVDISVSKIPWNDEEAVFLFINENEIAQKYKELDRQAKYKDKLLATVSHDLRTPLNGVLGMIRLASEASNEESVKESLSIAERSSQLLLNMINDLLDMSQISNGSLRLSMTSFSMLELIEEVSQLISFQAKYKGLEFIIEKKPNFTNKLLYNDPTRLKQIILNLLGNAVKFTEKGYIKISIENLNPTNLLDSSNIEGLDKNERSQYSGYTIKVEDSGNGIKKEDVPKLFKLFGKLETEENKRINQTGVGLGLSISQNLVKILNKNEPGYEISVCSEVGRGSCFSFGIQSFDDEIKIKKTYEDLHFQDSELINAVPEFESIKNPNSHLKSKAITKSITKSRVLVVEDDPISLMVVTSYLKFYDDLIFDVCHNGRDAVDTVNKMASINIYYDLILMDCNMPVMDGFQASRKILEVNSLEKRPLLVIVAMTANASPVDYENCFQAGMKDYLSKPFTKEKLREIILKYRKQL